MNKPAPRTLGSAAASSLIALLLLLLADGAGAPAARAEGGASGTVREGLDEAGSATQSGLERAGAATGRALNKAIEKTGEGIGTAIEKTGQGLQRAGEALTGRSSSAPPPHTHHELEETDLPPEDGGVYHDAPHGSAYEETEPAYESDVE